MPRIVGMFTLISACATSGDPGEVADTATVDPLCEDAEPLTWEDFGHDFLSRHCDACHAATVRVRNGAPEDATFDTVEQVWAWSDRILAVATGDSPTEPPAGGVTAEELTRLYWWLGCGTPGT